MKKATLDLQSSTARSRLHLALELSAHSWKLCFSDGKRIRLVTIKAEAYARLGLEIGLAKDRFGLAEEAPVSSCYEAGRDGFWIHRYLTSLGVESVVVEPASIQVERRARRVKTDRLDAKRLLQLLVRHASGEEDVWRIVRVPDEQAEDARRPHRERERLKRESTQHRNRLQALLVLQGIRLKPGRDFRTALECARCWDGQRLPPQLRQELEREYDRLLLVQEQVAQLEEQEGQRMAAAKTMPYRKMRDLTCLRGVGPVGASTLVAEFFGWRRFRNRREIGALAGLTATPYNSGTSQRDQGISKAGNRRVRAVMVELAWSWVRWQPDSKLGRWYAKRSQQGRMRRIAIVAVARKLLVDLWHFVEHGVVPEGAVLKKDRVAPNVTQTAQEETPVGRSSPSPCWVAAQASAES